MHKSGFDNNNARLEESCFRHKDSGQLFSEKLTLSHIGPIVKGILLDFC
jgi:hypothetical protein